MSTLTHLDTDGRPRMVDVSAKPSTAREAVAEGRIRMSMATLEVAMQGGRKGDARQVAVLAGIQGSKRTSDLIPLCHPLPLSSCEVTAEPDESLPGFVVTATARTTGQTGVEMEALTAASVACLTLYDMLKAVQKDMVIEGVRLLKKTGGKSGDWERREA
ncbi:cyclic pyranopterin monophosphate synthase MoaC [Parvularcula maris]|uniref:Cyclic pyranopterin monophosphate synthase n=1 Tax=Parvularcula maris TaxID=2965077 RepID=A0A9X2L8D3_9PROT|nr:cyclic pyranopterin monophosphate synthase MoaC [Parvularcula maris]MCQ8184858.1 cyclic pyranopterin monophosphate synthase MoaC [Parvularcula maris]